MSTINWVNEKKGNFSNSGENTFDSSKKNIGIRLQQGVPLLDRDWNELEDIRRYQEWVLRKYYIKDGAPDETSFQIVELETAANDFTITAGRYLVSGLEVVLDEDITYSAQDGVDTLSDVTEDREDIVYIDAWIEEITAEEDSDLANSQDIDIETCVRHRVNFLIKVLEGTEEYTAEDGHYYTVLAKISRTAEVNDITSDIITDSRRTSLGAYSSQALKYLYDLITNLETGLEAGTVIPNEAVKAQFSEDSTKLEGKSLYELTEYFNNLYVSVDDLDSGGDSNLSYTRNLDNLTISGNTDASICLYESDEGTTTTSSSSTVVIDACVSATVTTYYLYRIWKYKITFPMEFNALPVAVCSPTTYTTSSLTDLNSASATMTFDSYDETSVYFTLKVYYGYRTYSTYTSSYSSWSYNGYTGSAPEGFPYSGFQYTFTGTTDAEETTEE